MFSSSDIVCAIEFGTSKISVLIGAVSADDGVDIIGRGCVPSQGIIKGEISDVTGAENALIRALEEAENSCEELMNKVKEAPVFEDVAEILAKQVLFGQLTTARTTTQHKIGALENALIGDTDAATKAKIDIAVKIMAKDPAL